jgi:hypothetical protein
LVTKPKTLRFLTADVLELLQDKVSKQTDDYKPVGTTVLSY